MALGWLFLRLFFLFSLILSLQRFCSFTNSHFVVCFRLVACCWSVVLASWLLVNKSNLLANWSGSVYFWEHLHCATNNLLLIPTPPSFSAGSPVRPSVLSISDPTRPLPLKTSVHLPKPPAPDFSETGTLCILFCSVNHFHFIPWCWSL